MDLPISLHHEKGPVDSVDGSFLWGSYSKLIKNRNL